MEVSTFTCSICGEVSRDICVFCTKDACRNHLCERCHRCSDCCTCDMREKDYEHEPNGIVHPVESETSAEVHPRAADEPV